MSEAIYCPNCRIPIATAPFTGPVSCPQCGKQYKRKQPPAAVSVAEPAASPTPPMVAPAASAQTAPGSSATQDPFVGVKRRSTRKLQPVTSWLDIFDWKFEKYLTPWIVRATWVVCMLIAALWVIVILLGAMASTISLLPDSTSTSGPIITPSRSRPSNQPGWQFDPTPVTRPSSTAWVIRPIATLLATITSLCGVVIALLWVRVILETTIVLFNIASSLASIDEKTLNPEIAG